MKKALYGAFALCLVLSAVATAAPQISVDSATYDAGDVISGSSIQRTFVLSNTGTSDLEVSGVSVSCGCTTTKLDKTTLQPGDTVKLTATVAVTGTGSYVKKVYVDSNDPDHPRLTLTIAYTAVAAEVYELSAEDLSINYYCLIDVRSPEDYAAAHLFGAVNLPAGSFDVASTDLPSDVLIVVYDTDGTQSADVAQAMLDAGYEARALVGGLAKWVKQYGVLHGTLVLEPGGDVTVDSLEQLAPPNRSLTGDEIRLYITLQDLFPIYVLIDVRDAADYEAEHLFGAINIPADQLPQWYGVLPDSSAPGQEVYLVLYDADGSTTSRLTNNLIARGYDLARSLFGGLEEWETQYGDLWLVGEGK